jgi:hypothetical protein
MALPSQYIRAHDKHKIPHAQMGEPSLPATGSFLDRQGFKVLCKVCKGWIHNREWGIKQCKCI